MAIPDSVTYIGICAFAGCKSLSEVNIPQMIIAIGEDAFNGCTGLAEMNIPDSVTWIGSGAFAGCAGLTKVNISQTVTKIDEDAFKGCTGLTKVNIPNSVTKINDKAFSGCTGLSENAHTDSKIITVYISGIEKLLEPESDDFGETFDVCGRFADDEHLTFEIDGQKYNSSDFGDVDYGNEDFEGEGEINVEEFFQESGAKRGMLYINKASCDFEIELPNNEEFDPEKVTLICRDFIYPDGSDEPMLVAFIYDGKVYDDCFPTDSIGKSGKQIWKA